MSGRGMAGPQVGAVGGQRSLPSSSGGVPSGAGNMASHQARPPAASSASGNPPSSAGAGVSQGGTAGGAAAPTSGPTGTSGQVCADARECGERWQRLCVDAVFELDAGAVRTTCAQCTWAHSGAWCGCAGTAGARGACIIGRQRGIPFPKGGHSGCKRERVLQQHDSAFRTRAGWSCTWGAPGGIFFIGLVRGSFCFCCHPQIECAA